MRKISDKTKTILNEYLTNVLDIPVVYWNGRPTLEQKDKRRRELHNRLMEAFELEDRDVISQCNEAAYRAYLKKPFAKTACNAFLHELAVRTGENPLTPAQEAVLAKYCGELEDDHKIGERIYDKTLIKFLTYCDDVRRKHYMEIRSGWIETLSGKTPNELVSMAKQVPDRYMALCDEEIKRSHEWSPWCESMNFPYNGFSCVYYNMKSWFKVSSFYHDRFVMTGRLKERIQKFTGQEDEVKGLVNLLATLFTQMDAMREYLDTPWEDLVKTFLSFREKQDGRNG